MMILTFLKLAVTRFEIPGGRATYAFGRRPADWAGNAQGDCRVTRRMSDDGREWLRLSLEGGRVEGPKDELARFSLTSPEANADDRPDPERWM